MKPKKDNSEFVRITKPKTDKEIKSVLLMASLALSGVAYSICFN